MKQDSEPKEEFKNVPTDSARNWTEDYLHENGMYQNRCHRCNELFFGHKRRVVCKICFDEPLDWEAMAKKQPPTQHEGWAWQGCWADGEMTGFARCMVKKVIPIEKEIQQLREQLQAKESELMEAHENSSNQLELREEKIKFWVTSWNRQAQLIRELKEALSKIAYPIKHLQIEAEKEGKKIDGTYAIHLSENAPYLKLIAQEALTKPVNS